MSMTKGQHINITTTNLHIDISLCLFRSDHGLSGSNPPKPGAPSSTFDGIEQLDQYVWLFDGFYSLKFSESKNQFFEKKSESENCWFYIFQEAQRIDCFHESSSKEPSV